MAPLFGAKVKSALSGDTVVLTPARAPQPNEILPERVFSIAYVSAPRLRRDEGDETHAFESREALRLLLVGKVVQCEVLYTVPNGREYGIIYLPPTADSPRLSVVDNLISSGSVRVRSQSSHETGVSAEQSELLERYRVLEAAAKDAGLGVWAASAPSYRSYYDLPPLFVDKHKGESIDAVVERVINGDRLLVRLILPDQQVQVPLLIAGIRAPRSPPTNADESLESALTGEPYGEVAKYYVEQRLLQRNVKINILGISQQGVLIGSVLHPAGNIAEKILESGLAQVSDWQSSIVGAAVMSGLRVAERSGKSKAINIWHGLTTAAPAGAAGGAATSVVSRIISADTIAVRSKSGAEKVVQLASVRAPRQNDSKQASYVPAAREFVRKLIIGRHVKVTVIHTRPKSDTFEERDIVTIELPKAPVGSTSADLAAVLVENGFATVIRHRKGEVEDRSPIWDELVEMETGAIKAKKGFHSGVTLPAERVVNASESNARASAFLPSLQRQKRVPAVVEFVNTGSRLRLLLPRENARIKFILAGINTPRLAATSGASVGPEKSEPFGEEAREFTARRILQRDVEIDVTHADHSGGFFGLLHIPGTKDTFAKLLLDEGLARLDEYSAQEAGVASQFRAAEEEAQAKKKGLWKDDKTAERAAEAVAAAAAAAAAEVSAPKKEYLNVAISRVADDGTFTFVVLDTQLEKLQALTAQLSAEHPPTLTTRPRIGELVTYSYPESTVPGRFKVTSVDNGRKIATLASIDCGTQVTARLAKLCALPQKYTPALSVAALAREGKLSLVQFPTFQDDYADYAATYFYDIAATNPEVLVSTSQPSDIKKLVAVVNGSTAEHASLVALFDASSMDESINTTLAKAGWVYVPTDKTLRRSSERVWIGSAEVASLRAGTDIAKTERKGIWEYGDVTPDDE
ncbi:uncharacterized protein V1518DRAFT_262619 [Limtongia smithiae]|uniref:uncharacterized protein n=1 Tax=Limtongia smithiae TaxID=1125753 RepID=UPI0034CE87E2